MFTGQWVDSNGEARGLLFIKTTFFIPITFPRIFRCSYNDWRNGVELVAITSLESF